MTPKGIMFDMLNVIPYLNKHKKCPVTGIILPTSLTPLDVLVPAVLLCDMFCLVMVRAACRTKRFFQ